MLSGKCTCVHARAKGCWLLLAGDRYCWGRATRKWRRELLRARWLLQDFKLADATCAVVAVSSWQDRRARADCRVPRLALMPSTVRLVCSFAFSRCIVWSCAWQSHPQSAFHACINSQDA